MKLELRAVSALYFLPSDAGEGSVQSRLSNAASLAIVNASPPGPMKAVVNEGYLHTATSQSDIYICSIRPAISYAAFFPTGRSQFDEVQHTVTSIAFIILGSFERR